MTIARRNISETQRSRAELLNEFGLNCYANWELERAIVLFQEAIRLNNMETEYQHNLIQAQLRLERIKAILQAPEGDLPVK